MEISVWQGQETGSSSVWLELLNETGIEMWVPFLKGLTFDQRGHRDPRHLCPLPPGLSLPPNWPPPRAEGCGPRAEGAVLPGPLFQVQVLPDGQAGPFWNIPALMAFLTLLSYTS